MDMDSKDNANRDPRRRTRTPAITRRQFVKGVGATSAALTSVLGAGAANAADLPRVDENGQIAKTLNYVHDARTVDAAKRASDRYCNNCALYAGGPGDEWAACSIFPGKVVAGQGWCTAWIPKPSS
jgi:hypothetical protein